MIVNSTTFTQIVEPSWLERPSTEVAPDLLGCTLVRQLSNGQIIQGLIVETEAYAPGDPAFHAYRRRTPRNGVVFGPAGRSYIYLIYGLYHCFNIVTDQEGIPSAVLIRALQLESVQAMDISIPNRDLYRTTSPPINTITHSPKKDVSHSNKNRYNTCQEAKLERIAAGPGKLCRALQIDRSLNAGVLQPGQPLWLEHRLEQFQQLLDCQAVTFVQTTRIGLSQGIDLPWRWYISNCPSVSRANGVKMRK